MSARTSVPERGDTRGGLTIAFRKTNLRLTRLKKLSPLAVTLSNSNKSTQPFQPPFLKLLIVLLPLFKIDRETI